MRAGYEEEPYLWHKSWHRTPGAILSVSDRETSKEQVLELSWSWQSSREFQNSRLLLYRIAQYTSTCRTTLGHTGTYHAGYFILRGIENSISLNVIPNHEKSLAGLLCASLLPIKTPHLQCLKQESNSFTAFPELPSAPSPTYPT